MNKNAKPDHEDLVRVYSHLANGLQSVFDKKNRQYGNSFMDYGRVSLYLDMKRKWLRYKSCFKESDDSVSTDFDKVSQITPSLIDLANYSMLAILRELGQQIDCEINKLKMKSVSGEIRTDLLICSVKLLTDSWLAEESSIDLSDIVTRSLQQVLQVKSVNYDTMEDEYDL